MFILFCLDCIHNQILSLLQVVLRGLTSLTVQDSLNYLKLQTGEVWNYQQDKGSNQGGLPQHFIQMEKGTSVLM